MKRKKTALLTLLLCLVLGGAAVLLFLGDGPGGQKTAGEARLHTVRLGDEPAQETALPGGRSYDGPDVPARREAAEADYFADAAFAGTGTVAALGLYDYDGLLRDAAFLETDTLGDTGSYLDDLAAGGYGKIYLGFGPEELTRDTDGLVRTAGEAVRALREKNPGAVIYLMGTTPVSEYRSGTDALTTRERAIALNDALLALAREEGVYYLDVFTALGDGDGYLPGDVTEDGMSFTPAHYGPWYELLRTHYIDPAGEE